MEPSNPCSELNAKFSADSTRSILNVRDFWNQPLSCSLDTIPSQSSYVRALHQWQIRRGEETPLYRVERRHRAPLGRSL